MRLKTILLFIISILLIGVTMASALATWQDDFQSAGFIPLNGYDSWVSTTSTNDIIADPANASNKVAEIMQLSTSTGIFSSRDFTSDSITTGDMFRADFYLNQQGTAQTYSSRFILENTLNDGALYMQFIRNGATWDLYSLGGTTTIATGITDSVWHTYEVIPDLEADTFIVKIDGTEYNNSGSGYSFNVATTSLNFINFYDKTNALDELLIDNICAGTIAVCASGIVPSSDLSNFSTISTGNFNFDSPVSVGNSYGVVNSITFNNSIIATEPFYFASSLTTYGAGISPVTATCRITVDGTPVTESSRSISVGTYGNIALVSPADNLSLGVHTINTECLRSGSPNSNLNFVVNNSQLSEFLLYDVNSNSSIPFLIFDDPGPIALTSVDTEFGSFSFTTGNVSNSTNSNFLVTQGVVNYNYDVDSDISAYFVINETGETCGPYTRGGVAGSTGSVGASCLFTDLNSSTEYNIILRGYTSVGTGSFSDLTSNLYNIRVNTSAANISVLNTTLSADTLTMIASVDVTNILGGSYNVFSQASLIVNSNTTQDAYFYLSNSVNTSGFYRTLGPASGNIVIQNVFSESGTDTKDVKLYGYCPSGCNVSGVDLNAFVTDASTVSTGLFNITAYNVYNNSAISVFNVTIGGTTQTTTNGYVEAIGQGSINVLVEAENFFSNTTLHDTTTDLNASLVKYVEFTANEVSGPSITNFTINTSTNSYTTTNGVAYLPIITTTPVTFDSPIAASNTENVSKVQAYVFSAYGENSLRINIYDGTTTSLLTQQVNITTIDGSVSVLNTTSNGTIYVTLLDPNDYELRFVSSGYNSQNIYLTVNDDSTQEINIYMVSNSSSDLQRVQVLSLEGSQVEGAIVRLQQQVSGQAQLYYTIDEKTTNSEGFTAFYVDKSLDVYYRFIVIYGGIERLTTIETFFLPAVDEIIILNIPTTSTSGVTIPGLSVTTDLVATGNDSETYTFTWVDGANEITGARLVVSVRDFNITSPAETLYDSGIVSGFSGSTAYTLPVVNNTEFTVRTYIVLNTYETLVDEVPIVFGVNNVIERNSGLLIAGIVFIVIVLLTMSFGPLFSGTVGFIALLGLSLINVITFPVTIITSFIALLFIVFIKIKSGGQ